MSLPQPRTRRLARRITLCSALLAAALGAGAAPSAAAAPTFALRPTGDIPYYVLNATPGRSLHARIRVTNVGTQTGTARLYGVDAATGPTSGASYLTVPGRARAAGTWIRLSAGSVTLAPRQSEVVDFTVAVPRGAPAGDHLAGITADPGVRRGRTIKRNRANFRIDVRALTVIAVELRVPGTRTPRLSIDGIHAGGIRSYQQLFVKLSNRGNVLTRGSGSLVVRDGSGRVKKRAAFPLDTFVPSTSIQYPVLVHGRPLPQGAYEATITVRYDGRVVTRTFGFRVDAKALRQVYGSQPPANAPGRGFPLALIIAAAVLLLLAFVIAILWLRRRAARLKVRERELELARLELWRLRAPQSEHDSTAVADDRGDPDST